MHFSYPIHISDWHKPKNSSNNWILCLQRVSSLRMRGSSQIKQSHGFEVVRLNSRICKNDTIKPHKPKKLIFKGNSKFKWIAPTLISLLFLNACSRSPDTISSDNGKTQMQVCFTPGEDCSALLVSQINAAQKSIEVQAYSFTSYKIAKALVKAAQRGVDVKIILDKTQFDGAHFSVAAYLQKAGISLYDDNQVVIAHNKVMIIDNAIVETGSFNFTYAAQDKNAENMLIIYNTNLAQEYLNNWNSREQQSQLIHYSIPSEK